MARFKIDRNEYPVSFSQGYHFALYQRRTRTGLFGFASHDWDYIGNYKTKADALADYDRIKDLPEYLD